jgi:hypothetical protein
MRAMASDLSEDDMKELAEHFAGKPANAASGDAGAREECRHEEALLRARLPAHRRLRRRQRRAGQRVRAVRGVPRTGGSA